MKKIFILNLLIAFFLLSGCSIKNESKIIQSIKETEKQSAGQQDIQSTAKQPLAGNGKDIDEKAVWREYVNKKYKFKMEYPEGWKVSEEKSLFKIFDIEINSKAEIASKKIGADPFAFANGIYLEIYDKNKTTEEYIQTSFNNDPKKENEGTRLTSKTEKKLPNGMTAIYINCEAVMGPCDYILFDSANYIFQFSNYCNLNSFNSDAKQCDKIISSFEFIK